MRTIETRVKGVEDMAAKTVNDLKKVDDKVEQLRKELEARLKKRSKENNQSRDVNLLTKEEYREREARRLNLIIHRVKEPRH